MVQHCANCNRYQFPPRGSCPKCGNRMLAWKEIAGRGHIVSRVVVYDTPTSTLIPDQPFNVATISLDDEPELTMYSHLPGVPVDEVPIGAPVQVVFETTQATGQKIPEWRVVS